MYMCVIHKSCVYIILICGAYVQCIHIILSYIIILYIVHYLYYDVVIFLTVANKISLTIDQTPKHVFLN